MARPGHQLHHVYSASDLRLMTTLSGSVTQIHKGNNQGDGGNGMTVIVEGTTGGAAFKATVQVNDVTTLAGLDLFDSTTVELT